VQSKSVKHKSKKNYVQSKSTAEEALELMQAELVKVKDKEKLLNESIATIQRIVASQRAENETQPEA
jgi:hypothetical protein